MEFRFFTGGALVSAVILGSIIFFYLYYYLIHSDFFERYFETEDNVQNHPFKMFLFQKAAGFVLLGVVPGIIYFGLFKKPFSILGINGTALTSNLLILVALIVVIIGTMYLNHRFNPEKGTLQVNLSEWTHKAFAYNAAGWILYLTGYEILFRGVLLDACYSSFGFWPSIAINVVIYSAIHMVNGKEQVLGALVFGAIACFFALTKGTVLIPIVMHIVLNLSSDYFSISLNKNLGFKKSEPIQME